MVQFVNGPGLARALLWSRVLQGPGERVRRRHAAVAHSVVMLPGRTTGGKRKAD